MGIQTIEVNLFRTSKLLFVTVALMLVITSIFGTSKLATSRSQQWVRKKGYFKNSIPNEGRQSYGKPRCLVEK